MGYPWFIKCLTPVHPEGPRNEATMAKATVLVTHSALAKDVLVMRFKFWYTMLLAS